MDRVEEIRKRAKVASTYHPANGVTAEQMRAINTLGANDVPALLSRVEELERENEKLQSRVGHLEELRHETVWGKGAP